MTDLIFGKCGTQSKRLGLYYLFMHADGELSQEEKQFLSKIMMEEKVSESTQQEFQQFCEEVNSDGSLKDLGSVIARIDQLLSKDDYNFLSFGRRLERDVALQAHTIWTMINLGYAERRYSDAEKQVVNYLVKRWKMDSRLVSEFHDTAETILALTLQKEKMKVLSKSYEYTNEVIQELDRNITSMFSNIETSISEIQIA